MSPTGAVFESETLEEQILRIEIGESIKRIRKEREMTMVVLSRASQCSQSYLSRVESGVNIPSISMLRRLARALGVKPSFLLGEGAQSMGDHTERRITAIEQDP